jgi:predicted SAM-dependent methyltransferase
MTWSPLTPPCPCETPKTRWRAVPYTAGRGVDLGCGRERLFETEFVVGVDNGYASARYGSPITANLQLDARELTQFSAGSWDYVYSSWLLQCFPYKDAPAILRDWLRIVKPDGVLCLYLPDAAQYPKCAEDGITVEPGCAPDHQWNVTYDRVVDALKRTTWNWDLVDFERCDKDDEYSLWFVVRKLK